MGSGDGEDNANTSDGLHDGLPEEISHSRLNLKNQVIAAIAVIIRELKKQSNFYRLHLLYFLVLDLIGTLIIWGSPTNLARISFIDALFTSTSALTCTGLVPVYVATYSTFNTVVIMFLIILGGQVFTSMLPVLVRRYHFHKSIQRAEATLAVETENQLVNIDDSNHSNVDEKENIQIFSSSSVKARNASNKDDMNMPQSFTWSGETAKYQGEKLKLAMKRFEERRLARRISFETLHMESSENARSRPPSVNDETEDEFRPPVQSYNLRTKEYKALRTLSWLVPAYFISVQLTAFIILRITFWVDASQRATLSSHNVDDTYFSLFQVISSFGNAGFSLLDLSFIELQQAVVVLLVVGAMVLLGNTMYAPTMRGIVYLLHHWLGDEFSQSNGLGYLLDHPRKCFTHMFPFHQTLWLTVTVILFNSVELFFFCVLDWNSSPLQGLSGFFKLFDGLIQSLNTRSAGFLIVAISGLSFPMLFLYVGMMYVAVYPVYLSRQSSKPNKEVTLHDFQSESGTYHEQQVGLFDSEDTEFDDKSVGNQARKLIGRDSVLLFLSIFLIAIIHASDLKNDSSNYSIFSILFEVVSAYGNVGLSLGYTCPSTAGSSCVSPPYSFSGVWQTGAKLILCFVMLMGRHRGLPENIDDAVQLPSQEKFTRGLLVKDASLKFPDELVDPFERILLLRADAGNKVDIFKSVSNRIGGYSASSSPLTKRRGLPRGVSQQV